MPAITSYPYKNEDSPRVLIVDDEPSMRTMLQIMLKKEGCETETCKNAEEAIALFEQGHRFALVVTDLKMKQKSGIDLLRTVKRIDDACQVVLMTAFASAETALEAIREGAYDYMIKPFKIDVARTTIHRALEKHRLLCENLYLKQELQEKQGPSNIIGKSESMQRVFQLIERVAPTKTNVLITGESGTGKELAAKAIHEHSQVSNGPFLPINCGAIPENLIESELFGHVKGSFTGAIDDKKGLFEAAQGGSVFLDELGELPLNTQVRLLRVLQEKKIKPVGSAKEIDIDCRVIAATNRDLRKEVEEGRFREDLFYRLNVIAIELPPLRERNGDIKLLIEHYIKRYAKEMNNPIKGVTPEAMQILLNYHYPGNIRELQNIVERGVTLEMSEMITTSVLPYQLQNASFSKVAQDMEIPSEGIDLEGMVAELEISLIKKALERSGGTRTEAAKLLGISFRSLRYRLDKYNIEPEES